jgi:hypothetical protein
MWHFDRPENILLRTKDPSSDIVIADFDIWEFLTWSLEIRCTRVLYYPAAPSM